MTGHGKDRKAAGGLLCGALVFVMPTGDGTAALLAAGVPVGTLML
ncbi:hypothetical protein [Streptomyces sp. ISL-10]|nr:hypothetical protein [Streptomyces sp. ISL-10]